MLVKTSSTKYSWKDTNFVSAQFNGVQLQWGLLPKFYI